MTGFELIIGGKFASAVIGKVINLGRSYLRDNYDLHIGTRKMLENLVEIQLPQIQSVIEAAEEHKITNKGLTKWLDQLKDAAYEAEDILDDFEARRIRVSIKGSKGRVTEIASSSVKMVKTLIFSDKELMKLESVVDKLDKLCMGDFIKTVQSIHSDKGKEHVDNVGSETSSELATGVAIFGRDREIEFILDMMFNILYGDFYHKALDDPNSQQGIGEGSQRALDDPNSQQGIGEGSHKALDDPNSQQGKGEGSHKALDDPNSQQGKGEGSHKALDDPNSQQGKGEGSSRFLDLLPRFVKSFPGMSIPWLPKFKKGDASKHSNSERLRAISKQFDRMDHTIRPSPTIAEPKSEADEYYYSRIDHTIQQSTTIAGPKSIRNRKLAVITIFGVGGVGKTAVAKKIYNNEKVKEHFALKAWVYVTENCKARKIIRDILLSFGAHLQDNQLTNLEYLGKKLKETITNHRFFLILDNLRDSTELKWSDLESVLCYGEVGSVVVVTTQSISIANAIRTLPQVTLDVLQPETFWKLFQYYAFGGFKLGDLNDQPPLSPSKQEDFKKIGKRIADKLHGLPLAGEFIGTLLSKRLEREFWEDICGSDWWNIEGARENILPSIAIGYNYLDPDLKQCFVFCSIFPKYYVFEKQRLVQMWIAQGFIQPSKEEADRLDKGDIRLEDIGRKRFDKLVERSFFQPTLSDGKYVMHDLVLDLAKAVSTNEFCFIKSHDNHLPLLSRHVGIDCDNSEVEWKCKDSTRLRTVILFGNWTKCSAKSISDIFAKYNGLRVLDLSYIGLETVEPINAVCRLWHLRFADLSFTDIELIPDEFCALCHLQVLDVRGCKFKKLPEGMNKLINLRHLYASSVTISLISNIGKLTKLQELETFCVEKRKGHRISELMAMNEISGDLVLSDLNNVPSKKEAAKAQLEKKKYLKSLELRYNLSYSYTVPTIDVEMEVLNSLKPAQTLEILKVSGCKSIPDWVFSPHYGFYNLKVIHVFRFWSRSSLPAFGELPSLELLTFDDLPLIEKVGSEFYGSSDVAFQSLKELKFSKMSSWREWLDAEAGKTIFPCLKKLHLKECRVLKELPTGSFNSSVIELKLSECPDLCNIQTVLQGMPSLAHLSITEVHCECLCIDCTPLNSLEVINLKNIKQLCFVGGLKSLDNLRKLVIDGFREILDVYDVEQENDQTSQEGKEEQGLQFLTYLHLRHNFNSTQSLLRVGRLSSLRTLVIENSPAVEYTRDEESWFNQLTSLEKLEFRRCLKLKELPSQLYLLTSLKKLHIYSCNMIVSLPRNGLPQNLTELYIEECPHLTRRCQPNQGDDWYKIYHIPVIHYNGEIGPPQEPPQVTIEGIIEGR